MGGPQEPRIVRAELALRAAAGIGALLMLRRAWWLGPPVIATVMLAGAPALHLLWWLLELPGWLPAVVAVVAAVFAGVEVGYQRQGLPRLLGAAGTAAVIGWSWWVWTWGPSWLAIELLGWALLVAWPLWLWHRRWRGRERFVQVSENRFELRTGAPDPAAALGSAWRAWQKARRRRRNQATHRKAQAERDLARARVRARVEGQARAGTSSGEGSGPAA